MCCLKKTGLIWLLIHYYYDGDAPPPGPAAEPTPGPNIALGALAHYFQNASASAAFACHGAACLTASLGYFIPVNFMR